MLARAERKKGRNEAAGKGRLRFFSETALRTSDFGRVPGQEVIHGLFRIESCNRGKSRKGICREKEDVLRVPSDTGKHRIVYELQWISSTRVFRDRIIVIVGGFAFFVENHVFKDRTRPNCIPDLWLALLGEVNALRVAAPFEIENPRVAPTVLVISDQVAIGVCRQSGLAGARKAKKQSGLAIDAAIGRTVHRENLTVREKIVQHRENGFLDLSRVTRPPDENDARLEVDRDDRFRPHLVDKRVGLKAGSDHDGEVRG